MCNMDGLIHSGYYVRYTCMISINIKPFTVSYDLLKKKKLNTRLVVHGHTNREDIYIYIYVKVPVRCNRNCKDQKIEKNLRKICIM